MAFLVWRAEYRNGARILTSLIYTSVLWRTVRIGCALGCYRWYSWFYIELKTKIKSWPNLKNTRTLIVYNLYICVRRTNAFDVRISLEAIQTRACRLMSLGYTCCLLGASILFADGSASSVQPVARFVVCTVFVILAHYWYTRYHGWTLCTRRASAMSSVSLYNTFSSVSTALSRTRVQTIAVDARFIVHTIAVGLATS